MADPVSDRVGDAEWAQCRAVVREHGKTFHLASYCLPPERRRAIHAAYAWCRIADDIVDRAPTTGLAAAARALDAWEGELDRPVHPVSRAFAAARVAYAVPAAAARDLVAGVRMDLAPRRYDTWDELRVYCYRVAGTVGLIAAPIMGLDDDGALPHAVDLGIAMQLTNILRDVGEDALMGRLYLPLDDLAGFGVCPETTLTGRPSGRFRDLMAFQIARARALYASAHQGIPALSPAGQLAALASARLYAKILARIEDNDYDVFGVRAVVPNRGKLRAAPTIAADFVRLRLPDPIGWLRA